jgi:hypothetical protein
MARKSGPSLLMLYTMRCALVPAVAGTVAPVPVPLVPVALVVAALLVTADAAQPVTASAPASTVARSRAAERFLGIRDSSVVPVGVEGPVPGQASRRRSSTAPATRTTAV